MEFKCPICKQIYECEDGTIMLICPACQIDILRKRRGGDDGYD